MIDFFCPRLYLFSVAQERLKNSLKQQLQFANTNFENKLPCLIVISIPKIQANLRVMHRQIYTQD